MKVLSPNPLLRVLVCAVLAAALSSFAACGRATPGTAPATMDRTATQPATSTPTATSSPTSAPTDTPSPTSTPSVEDLWSVNDVGSAASGAVSLTVVRLVVGYKWAIPDQPWSGMDELIEGWAGADVVGEIVIRVTNNRKRTVSFHPDQGWVRIGEETVDLGEYMAFTAFGDDLGGEYVTGESRLGGLWFAIRDSSPSTITQITYRCDGPFDARTLDALGPEIELVLDVSLHTWQEVPEEMVSP